MVPGYEDTGEDWPGDGERDVGEMKKKRNKVRNERREIRRAAEAYFPV